LDPTLRERNRREIRDVIRRVGITTILVTHEQDEAFDLGDRVAVLRQGRLEQAGTPDELYVTPANQFVAGFVGRSSSLRVEVIGPSERGTRIRIGSAEWDVERSPGQPPLPPGAALMLVRPEALRLTAPGAGAVIATVRERRFVGPSALYTVVLDGAGAAIEVEAPQQAVRIGEPVGIMPSRRAGGGIHLFPDHSP
jgi:putative spermidine/putrescine transport system ATP-binding protein